MARKRKKADDDELDETVDAGDEGDEGDGAPFSVGQFIDPAWVPPAKAPASPGDRKVTNKYIPLFPDATKSPKQHAASIKVYKTNPPNEGFKGVATSPETVDEAYIAGLWGDGRYKLELLDQAKNVLRVRDDVVVSCGAAGNGSSNGHNKSGADVESILARVTEANEKAMQKILDATEARLAREHEQAKEERAAERERAKEHASMTTGLVKSEAEQLRLHYAAQSQQAENNGRMMMAMMMQGHQMTIQMMTTSQQQQMSRSDPLLFLRVFQEGMNNAPEDGADKVTGNIVKGLEALRGVAGAPQGLPPGAPPPKGLPAAAPAAAAPANGKPGAKEKEITKEELREIILLKRAAKVKGVALMDLVSQAKTFYADPNQAVDEEVDDDEDDPDAETDEERAARLKKRKKGAANAADANPTEQPGDDVDGEGSPDA